MTDLADPPARALTPVELASVDFAKMRRTCDMCVCFNPLTTTGEPAPLQIHRGQCRASPPTLTQIPVPIPPKVRPLAGQPPAMPEFTEMSLSGWPIVTPSDWCINGFKPLPEANQ